MLDLIREKLRIYFPQIAANFGSNDNFINIINSDSSSTIKLKSLLSHPDTAVVISPTHSTFKLYEDYEDGENPQSIIFEQPYSIHNLDGELLYRVSNHNGIFGYSLLDKALLLQSRVGDFYYLQYSTFSGKRTLLLIVNAYTLESQKKISIGRTLDSEKEIQPTSNITNTLLFHAADFYRNNTVPGNPGYPLVLNFLKSSPRIIPSTSAVISNPLTEKLEINPDLDPIFTYHPQTSGWLVISQSTGNPNNLLRATSWQGAGIDRFVEASPGLYYIAVGSEISLESLRQTLGILGRADNILGTQTIDLKVELERI